MFVTEDKVGKLRRYIAKLDKDWVERADDREDWRSRREAFAQQWASTGYDDDDDDDDVCHNHSHIAERHFLFNDVMSIALRRINDLIQLFIVLITCKRSQKVHEEIGKLEQMSLRLGIMKRIHIMDFFYFCLILFNNSIIILFFFNTKMEHETDTDDYPLVISWFKWSTWSLFVNGKLLVFPIVGKVVHKVTYILEEVNDRLLHKGTVYLEDFFDSHSQLLENINNINDIFEVVQRNEEMLKLWVQSGMLKRQDVSKVMSFISPRSIKRQGIVTGDTIIGLPYLAKSYDLTEDLFKGLDEFTCSMYGSKRIKDVDEVRAKLIKKRLLLEGLEKEESNDKKNSDGWRTIHPTLQQASAERPSSLSDVMGTVLKWINALIQLAIILIACKRSQKVHEEIGKLKHISLRLGIPKRYHIMEFLYVCLILLINSINIAFFSNSWKTDTEDYELVIGLFKCSILFLFLNCKLLVLAIVRKVVHKVNYILEEVNDRLMHRGTVYLDSFFDIHSQLLEKINIINDIFEEILSMALMSILIDVLIIVAYMQHENSYLAFNIIPNVVVLTLFCVQAQKLTNQTLKALKATLKAILGTNGGMGTECQKFVSALASKLAEKQNEEYSEHKTDTEHYELVIGALKFSIMPVFLNCKLLVLAIVGIVVYKVKYILKEVNDRLMHRGTAYLDAFFDIHSQLLEDINIINDIFKEIISMTVISILIEELITVTIVMQHGIFNTSFVAAFSTIPNVVVLTLFCIEAHNLTKQVQRNEEMLKVWVQSDLLKKRDVLKVLSFISPRSIKSQGIVTGDMIIGLPYLATEQITDTKDYQLVIGFLKASTWSFFINWGALRTLMAVVKVKKVAIATGFCSCGHCFCGFCSFVLSLLWSCGLVVLWSCGLVVLWSCGLVVLWSCGLVVLWSCGLVVLWSCGLVVLTERQTAVWLSVSPIAPPTPLISPSLAHVPD
ncbi:hypothetical protein GQR58_017931 [Nymphon striatum]|nr:hypothetical protein GQR58_017931 [Nymphon striatum]